ncbi:MAG: hypothetical protein JXA37_06395 [Chloroflexia bacterium]|nr:hypothetical protein [Chloroflexia bacterium]
MSLKELVGQKTYEVWVDMLSRLVPTGRTHRLAPMIAGMLQYAADLAYEKHGNNLKEGTVGYALIEASEMYDPDEAVDLLSDVLGSLFADAEVEYERVSSQGEGYSVARSAIYEFIHWYDMPWEA